MSRAIGLDPLLSRDLDEVLERTSGWEELRGRRLFITGGTGFFGTWLLHTLVWANRHLGLDASALVLTRNPASFRARVPDLAGNRAIAFHAGDVRSFRFPEGRFSHVIHAATTSAVATFNNEEPLEKFETVVEGTRRTLDFAVQCGAHKFLLTGSGAVYGAQPADLAHVPEDFAGAPDPLDAASALGEAKRAAEFLCACYSRRFGLQTKIARCFSFVGPYLQLDIHYAVGNFIRDALRGGPILVRGDGTARRGYLYAGDLVTWLWTILFNGADRVAYNVGSEHVVTIGELARIVSECAPQPTEVVIAQQPVAGSAPNVYVPSTARARTDLRLAEAVPLPEAIRRTMDFHRAAGTLSAQTGAPFEHRVRQTEPR